MRNTLVHSWHVSHHGSTVASVAAQQPTPVADTTTIDEVLSRRPLLKRKIRSASVLDYRTFRVTPVTE